MGRLTIIIALGDLGVCRRRTIVRHARLRANSAMGFIEPQVEHDTFLL